MYEKSATRSVFPEALDNPGTDARISAKWPAVLKAQRQEIHPPAPVTAGGKPDVLVPEFSASHHDRLRPKPAALKTAALRLSLSDFDLNCLRRVIPQNIDLLG